MSMPKPAAPAWRVQPRWISLAEASQIALAFVVTRVALVAVGLLANAYVPGLYGPQWERLEGKPLLDMWFRWDAGFYTAISMYGFNFAVNQTPASDIAFMPFYPAMLRLALPLVGCADRLCETNAALACSGRECAVAAGILVSNVALFASGFLLFDLIRQQFDARTAMRSVWLLMLAPNSIFFSGVYTESLFVMLALVTFQALSRRAFGVAVLAAGFASLTREVGLALYPALIVYAWNMRGKTRLFHLLTAQIAPLFFFGYVIGAGLHTGHWLAYFNVNVEVWGVSVGSNAIGSFGPFFPPYEGKEYISLWGAGPTWLNFATTLIYLALAIPSFKQNPSYGFFALVAILIPIVGGTLASMPRFGGAVFPHYVVGAQWANSRWKQAALVVACFVAGAFFTVRFVTWRWIA